jgi:glyoxylase-like metal-dependent hydrolase (beta-lactamase superfamily II)
MSTTDVFHSKHFEMHQLAEGVFAAIHKDGGAAYSNAGIIDLGDRTLVIDAFDTALAARDLRQISEELFSRPVEIFLLTHTHFDHWKGAYVFDENTTMYASEITRQETIEWVQGLLEDIKNPSEWIEYVQEMEDQLQNEGDERDRLSLERSIQRTRYFIDEMSEFTPRYADHTFTDSVSFKGSKRSVEFRSFGVGHSSDDAVLLLPQDGIAFIGDIGFFNLQPFMGVCNLDLWRQQLSKLQESEYRLFVPGHGTLGGRQEIDLQLAYFDVMEELIGKIVQEGGPLEDAMKIRLPEPFESWLMGSMERFKVNVQFLYKHLGGEIPEES